MPSPFLAVVGKVVSFWKVEKTGTLSGSGGEDGNISCEVQETWVLSSSGGGFLMEEISDTLMSVLE